MIKIMVIHVDEEGISTDLAVMKFERIEPTYDEADHADYQFQLVASNGEDVLIRQRYIKDFPRRTTNVLGLIRVALMELKLEDYHLVGDGTASGYMARGFDRALQALQGSSRKLRDRRSALRSGQLEQHGGDAGGEGIRDQDPERRITGAGDLNLQAGDGLPASEDDTGL